MPTLLFFNIHSFINIAYKYRQIGPIYYEYGSMILTYDNADIAVKAYYMLRESVYDEKNLLVLLLPNIMPEMVPKGVRVSDYYDYILCKQTAIIILFYFIIRD